MQRVRAEALVQECLGSVPTPKAEDAVRGVNRTATAKLAGYAALGALGLFAGIALGRAELAVLAPPFALVLFDPVSSSARAGRSGSRLEVDRRGAVEGEEVRLRDQLAAAGGSSDSSCRSRCRATSIVAERHVARRSGSPWAGAIELTTSLALYAVGHLQVGRAGLRGIRPARPPSCSSSAPGEPAGCRVPERRGAAGARAPARDPGVHRQPRRPAEGRGDRVRRPAPATRPATAAPDELARKRPPPGARGRREASGAKRRCRAPARHVRRGAARRMRPRSTWRFAPLPGSRTGTCERQERVRLLEVRRLARLAGARRWEPSSSTASSRRCSTPRSSSGTHGGASASSLPTRYSRRRSCSRLTPLLDERMVNALADVRGRGADVAADRDRAGVVYRDRKQASRPELAYRIWKLRRAAVRSRFRRLGVPVVQWRWGDPLEPVLEEVSSFRDPIRRGDARLAAGIGSLTLSGTR